MCLRYAAITGILFCFLLFSPISYGYTGNDLLRDINTGGGTSYNFAAGYIAGTVDTLVNFSEHRPCVPEGVTYSQYVDIVAKTLENYPESRHGRASVMIWIAVKSRFPCND